MECLNNPLHQGESAKIWRADDLGDIELLHARYLTYSFAKHTHEGAAVGVIEAGVERTAIYEYAESKTAENLTELVYVNVIVGPKHDMTAVWVVKQLVFRCDLVRDLVEGAEIVGDDCETDVKLSR